MSHFLARLVERARGTAARVEPLIAPRFAPTPIVEIASEVEAPAPVRRDQKPTLQERSLPGAVVQPEAPARKAEPNVLQASEKSSLPQQPEKLLVPMEKSAVDYVRADDAVWTNSTVFVRPSPSSNRPVPAVKNGMARRNSFTASRSKGPQPAPRRTTRSRSFEHDLLMPNESPEQPPIVRVTIGRIDVRATTPAAPLRKSPTRSEPKLTLDAYLKSRREGRR
jgi:hypothetical protein